MKKKTEKKENLLLRLVPGYARIPLLSAVALNILCFNGTRALTKNKKHYNMTTPLDKKIPLKTKFSYAYVLAFAQWISGYIIAARQGKDVCKRVVGADLIAKSITMGCFLAMPTEMDRPSADAPELSGKGLDKLITRIIYKADAANQLFPSIHCLESWMVYKSVRYVKNAPFWYRPLMFCTSVAVFFSTVFLKQHVVVDIPAGIACAEAGYHVMGKLMDKK